MKGENLMGIARTTLKGVTHYVPSRAYSGYTLFSPMFGKDVWLVDMQGRIVHRWRTEPYKPNFARFLANGNLLYQGVKSGGIMGPGLAYLFGEHYEQTEEDRGVCLIEVDWDNNLVLKYEEPQFNHDFYRMKNGNTMLIKYVDVPDDIKNKVKGGIPGTEQNGIMWADALNEVTPDGEVVWEWLAYEHLDPEMDVICPLEYRGEWTHMNTCSVLPDGNILGSFRQTNTICIIDKATGNIIWRWGRDELGHQHEPTMLDNGNILVFDNGPHRFLSQDLDYYSRVLEVNPATNKIEWEYKDDPPSEFYAFGMGGAQRLPNENTLICETHGGRIFEVTRDREIIWEYVSPFYGPFLTYGQANLIYRAYRYGHEYQGLKGKNLDPNNFRWLNAVYGPGAK
ncbi:aryl sulfotransferase [Candidatus Aerophobetes bacterium Ae_b3b]|nr:MAG: aryl sulfotransferase [Candidatus Aerophobetes bacterium Ae_b3b]